jgi:predicted signal transduction protein with EAL and GGDEF domain
VVQVCEQVCAAVREHDWSPVTGAIPVTVSIGVSTATTGSTSPGILLAGADRNLYTAKRNGRDCVVGDQGIEAAERRPAAESGRVPGREREDANQRAVCHAPYRRPRAGAPG